jgi:2-polyprenyl-6-methoxyphenol hydroxylase-like FAD-dependent oxidoreductase
MTRERHHGPDLPPASTQTPQRMLVDALPDGTVQLGKRLDSLVEDASGVTLVFDDGTRETFDLVVGADGLSSRVRDHVQASRADEDGGGGGTPPTYSGIRVQFGVVPSGGARPAGSSGEFHQWFGEGVYALTGSYGTGAADGVSLEDVRTHKPAPRVARGLLPAALLPVSPAPEPHCIPWHHIMIYDP